MRYQTYRAGTIPTNGASEGSGAPHNPIA